MQSHFSKRYWFRDWPNPTIPAVAAGVYVVWRGDELIYAGMSGKDIEKKQQKRKYGLVTRLSSHASGSISGRRVTNGKRQMILLLAGVGIVMDKALFLPSFSNPI